MIRARLLNPHGHTDTHGISSRYPSRSIPTGSEIWITENDELGFPREWGTRI